MRRTLVVVLVLLSAAPGYGMPEGKVHIRGIPPAGQSHAQLITGPPAPPREIGTPAGPVDLGEAVDAIPGTVAIILSKSTYREGEQIFATIANGLSQTLHATDHKTDCTFAVLQQWTGTDWVALYGCRLGIPAMPYKFGPGHGRRVAINPASMHMPRPFGRTLAFMQGWYRLAFLYTLTASPRDISEVRTAYSPAFRIVP